MAREGILIGDVCKQLGKSEEDVRAAAKASLQYRVDYWQVPRIGMKFSKEAVERLAGGEPRLGEVYRTDGAEVFIAQTVKGQPANQRFARVKIAEHEGAHLVTVPMSGANYYRKPGQRFPVCYVRDGVWRLARNDEMGLREA